MKKLIILIFLLLNVSVFCEETAEQKKINKYLLSTVQLKNKQIVSSKSQSISISDIIEGSLTFSTGDANAYNTIKAEYFLKSNNKLISFSDINTLIASKEFIASIKAKKFNLKTEDDAVAFQSFLKLIDNERGLGYFKEDNTWYFIRSKFFKRVRACIVKTDKMGQVAEISIADELKKAVPEKLLKVGETTFNANSKKSIVSKKDSIFIYNSLKSNSNYTFEVSPLDFYSLNKISTISISNCAMKVTEGVENMSSTSITRFMLVSNNNEYIKKTSINDLFKMPLFIKSLQKKYTIKTKEDARLFQYILDDLEPISQSDIALKTFYKKDNMWVFVREKRFDDIKGYIVLLDDKNKVSYMEYTEISEESFLKIKMRDPNFKVDYKFKLVKPATNKVTLKRGEGLSVEISFDEDAVNAKGCWIKTEMDGRGGGMYAGTSIKSPYRDGMTGMSLENNSYTIKYFLMDNGDKDTKNALDSIIVDLKIND